MSKNIILVDKNDNEIGVEEKLRVHQKGLLHRAFSIFIFNSNNEMLIQKRAFHKYHSGGLWTNACCSHPYPNESLETATNRRMQEEIGIKCNLKPVFNFIYNAPIPKDNLIEHEFDHVFFGFTNQTPKPNPDEIAKVKWVDIDVLIKDARTRNEKYTKWFLISLDKVVAKYKKLQIQ